MINNKKQLVFDPKGLSLGLSSAKATLGFSQVAEQNKSFKELRSLYEGNRKIDIILEQPGDEDSASQRGSRPMTPSSEEFPSAFKAPL